MEPMINLTGLWIKKDKNGNEYFQGKLNNATVWIFKNNHKENESQPDYNMSISQGQRKETGDYKGPAQTRRPVVQRTVVQPQGYLDRPITEDDVAF